MRFRGVIPVVHNARMKFLFDFVGRVIRSMLRLLLFVAAGVFALSLLTAVLGAVVLTALWSLLTGRKPAVFTTFSHFRQATRQFKQGGWPPMDADSAGRSSPAEVVDVQVREVQERPLRTNLPLEQKPKV